MQTCKYKKVIKGVILFIAVFICILIAGSIYMFNVALKTQVSSTDEEDAYAFVLKNENIKNWVDSLNSENALRDTIIIAPDGAKLHGLYVKAAKDSANTALVIHGYTDNSIRMLMIGQIYSQMGYNILLPDLRGQGKSQNDHIQMGWKDRLDILKWIDVCRETFGESTPMVLHGISMGAATTMMTSGENLPENVKCFIEDCGYSSVWQEYEHELKKRYGLPSFPLLNATSFYCQLNQGWNFKEASAIDQVKKCNLPMFFIHGGNDDYVPTWMVYDLYEAKKGDKELWVEPGVAHANMYWDHTDEYIKRTRNFVDKYIH